MESILKSENAYAIMPVGKEKQVVHVVRLQRKAPVLQHRGFSIPYLGMAGLRTIGWLPTIYRRPTI